MTALAQSAAGIELRRRAAEGILVLDGAMGTEIQALNLGEAGYRGARFSDWSCDLRGNNDILILSQPDIEGYVFITPLSSQQLDNTARGIVKAFKELYPTGMPNIPCVLCFRGAWDETALAMFEQHGLTKSPWVRLLGRDETERDVAVAFRELHTRWRREFPKALAS